VGFLTLFPGLFEVGLSQTQVGDSQSSTFIALLATRSGLYALGHLLGSVLQLFGGSNIAVIAGRSNPLIHILIALAFVSLGLEAWGRLYKGYLTFFAFPGIVAGILCVYLYYAVIRRGVAA
jgi:hypothetical protein